MAPAAHDAIVVGAGPNGLVAANLLVDAGWDVLVLEAQPDVGGAVRTDREVDPEFAHDTFSAFYPLCAASPAIAGLGLEEYGLRWCHAPAVLGHPRRDGRWAVLHRDVDATAAALNADTPGDGDTWHVLHDRWRRIGPAIIESALSPFPPVRGAARTAARLPSVGGLSYARMLLQPVRRLAESRFAGDSARLLLAGSAAHTDVPVDAIGSGFFAVLLTMLGQSVGFPVPQGGAGRLADAMARRLVSNGGTLRCNARVTRIQVDDGRASAVTLQDGETVEARRAIVADVAAPHLYGGLVDWDHLPARTRRGMGRFELDPATVKVDWALDGPVPWASPPEGAPGTVHIADSVDQIAESGRHVSAGVVPTHPFVLAGQMTSTDPSRSPRGTEALWAYAHVPQRVLGDAGGDGITGAWGRDDAERMADRIQGRIEEHAPGLSARIRARRVLTPVDLERRDANLVGGAINGGTARLRQQLLLRPVPGFGRAETPIRGLYLGSASAHPGGGVHGAAGANAARAALAWARFSRCAGGWWSRR